jgi:hypothetical protein
LTCEKTTSGPPATRRTVPRRAGTGIADAVHPDFPGERHHVAEPSSVGGDPPSLDRQSRLGLSANPEWTSGVVMGCVLRSEYCWCAICFRIEDAADCSAARRRCSRSCRLVYKIANRKMQSFANICYRPAPRPRTLPTVTRKVRSIAPVMVHTTVTNGHCSSFELFDRTRFCSVRGG